MDRKQEEDEEVRKEEEEGGNVWGVTSFHLRTVHSWRWTESLAVTAEGEKKKKTSLGLLKQKQICLHHLRGLGIKNHRPVIWPGVGVRHAFLFLSRKEKNPKKQVVLGKTNLILTPTEAGIPQSTKPRQHVMFAAATALFWCYQSFPGRIMEFIMSSDLWCKTSRKPLF